MYARVRSAAPVLQCVLHLTLRFADVCAVSAHVCIGYKLQVLTCRGFQSFVLSKSAARVPAQASCATPAQRTATSA